MFSLGFSTTHHWLFRIRFGRPDASFFLDIICPTLEAEISSISPQSQSVWHILSSCQTLPHILYSALKIRIQKAKLHHCIFCKSEEPNVKHYNLQSFKRRTICDTPVHFWCTWPHGQVDLKTIYIEEEIVSVNNCPKGGAWACRTRRNPAAYQNRKDRVKTR